MAIQQETLDMPFNSAFHYGLFPGSRLVLEGLIPEQSKRFYIELATGQYDHADKALRFEAHFKKAVVVLKCLENRQWIKEKKLPSPWKPGERFSIAINVTEKHYKIFTEGRLLDEFPHCLPPRQVFFLEMDGDVILERYTRPRPAGH